MNLRECLRLLDQVFLHCTTGPGHHPQASNYSIYPAIRNSDKHMFTQQFGSKVPRDKWGSIEVIYFTFSDQQLILISGSPHFWCNRTNLKTWFHHRVLKSTQIYRAHASPALYQNVTRWRSLAYKLVQAIPTPLIRDVTAPYKPYCKCLAATQRGGLLFRGCFGNLWSWGLPHILCPWIVPEVQHTLMETSYCFCQFQAKEQCEDGGLC